MTSIALRRPVLNQKKVGIFVLDHIIEMCLLILIIALTVGSHGFLTWANWMNIFRSNSLKGVISLGMTLALIAGQVDLSIGSTVGLSGVIVAIVCREMVARGADVNVACLIGIVLCFAMAVAVVGELMKHKRIHEDALTVNGKTMGANCREAPKPYLPASRLYSLSPMP